MHKATPIRVLVVDDEPSVADIIQFSLSDEGYHIDTARDGASGLERFRSGKWDLVVLDRCMPEMNGCELAAAIRSLAPTVPIVMLTGLPELLEEDFEFAHAIDSILRKPFTLRQLREAVKKALEPRA